MTGQLEAALSYAQRGWCVFPVYEMTGDGCACSRAVCDRPGKHPRLRAWPKAATTDRATIVGWWTRWPDANVAIATGRRSGLFVLDVDPRHGGDDSLFELEREHGHLPPTVEGHTGGDGRHLFFALPSAKTGIGNSHGKVGVGLDVRADGGYVVAPPSRHASGGRYCWSVDGDPAEVPLADPPPWLLARLPKHSTNKVRAITRAGQPIPTGTRNSTLFMRAASMRRAGFSQPAILAAVRSENALCQPPLEDNELTTIAASVGRYPPPWITDRQSFIGDPRLASSPRLVLHALVDHANASGWTRVTLATLEDCTGLNESTIRKAIKELERHGRISIRRRSRRLGNIYAVLPYPTEAGATQIKGGSTSGLTPGKSLPATGDQGTAEVKAA